MANECLTPEDLTPCVPDDATPADCVAMWIDLMNTCEQFLLAGLRREIGPQGDLRAAYRQWYTQRMEEHDRMIEQLAQRLNASGGGSGR
jgi:hypothetical protein